MGNPRLVAMVHVVLQVGVGRWSGITWRLPGSQGNLLLLTSSSPSEFRPEGIGRESSASERENFLPGVKVDSSPCSVSHQPLDPSGFSTTCLYSSNSALVPLGDRRPSRPLQPPGLVSLTSLSDKS